MAKFTEILGSNEIIWLLLSLYSVHHALFDIMIFSATKCPPPNMLGCNLLSMLELEGISCGPRDAQQKAARTLELSSLKKYIGSLIRIQFHSHPILVNLFNSGYSLKLSHFDSH